MADDLDPPPLCLRCGHAPCPCCADWCDVMVWNVYCPTCDEPVREQKEGEKDGDLVACLACPAVFPLDRKELEPDPCCEGRCVYAVSYEKVYEWCQRARQPPFLRKVGRLWKQLLPVPDN